MQREAAGAIRNITLDEKCREAFGEGALDALLGLLDATDDMQLLICMAGALRNLSIADANRKAMHAEKAVVALVEALKSENSKLQNLALATLINIAQDDGPVQTLLAQHFTKTVYEPLLASKVPNVHENTVTLLKNMKEHLPDAQGDPIGPSHPPPSAPLPSLLTHPLGEALRDTGAVDDAKLELDLLKKLNLDGTISQKDVLLVKKIGEGQYGDVWQAKYHGFPVACKILKRQLNPKDAEKVGFLPFLSSSLTPIRPWKSCA